MSTAAKAAVVALFGPPGSGKGTQAERIVEEFGTTHLAPGNMLRDEIKRGTDLGKAAESIMKAGKLVTDDVINPMVTRRIGEELKAGRAVLLDGYPRTIPQLEYMEQYLASIGAQVSVVFRLEIAIEALLSRLLGRLTCPKCGAIYHEKTKPPVKPGVCDACGAGLVKRQDDNEQSVRQRMDAYRQQTQPILDRFEAEGKAVLVEADRDPVTVYADISRRLRQ
ncbi:nucleoside monophosphate kinase [bacterium]|nr:nucleoside monophosphate kinase [bacterium]